MSKRKWAEAIEARQNLYLYHVAIYLTLLTIVLVILF